MRPRRTHLDLRGFARRRKPDAAAAAQGQALRKVKCPLPRIQGNGNTETGRKVLERLRTRLGAVRDTGPNERARLAERTRVAQARDYKRPGIIHINQRGDDAGQRFPGRQCKLPGNTDLGRIHQRPVYPPTAGFWIKRGVKRQTRRQDDEIARLQPCFAYQPVLASLDGHDAFPLHTFRIRDQQIRAGKLLQPAPCPADVRHHFTVQRRAFPYEAFHHQQRNQEQQCDARYDGVTKHHRILQLILQHGLVRIVRRLHNILHGQLRFSGLF